MKKTNASRLLLATLALAACGVQAQPGRAPAGPPNEALALVPGIDAAQAKEIRRIESERRDAHDQLAIRQRGEHARIDDEADDKLRQRLGDERYRAYIGWKAESLRGRRGPGGGPLAGPAGPPPRDARADVDVPTPAKPAES